MAVHQLKTWPAFFQAIVDGDKRYEIRRMDHGRDFKVGDVLMLREYDPEHKLPAVNGGLGAGDGFTGRIAIVTVTYMTLGGQWGLPDELCVMSITSPNEERALVEKAKRCGEAG